MAEGGITLDIKLEDAKLIAGLLRAAGAQKQFNKEIDNTKTDAAKAEKELDRMSAAVKKMTATPLEKYNSELAKLNTLQQRGKITTEDHTRAVAMHKRELDRATNAGKTSIADIAGSIGIITSASGAASAAINLITAALRESNAQVREAKQLLDDLEDPLIEINAVSSSAGQAQQRTARAAAAAAREGVPVKTAQRVLLDAIGADAEDSFETILSTRRGVMSGADAGTVVAKMTGLFKGKVTAEQALDLVGAAAASDGTKDTVAQLVPGIPKAALGGSALGASPQETIAALTSVSDALGGNSAMAGDRLNTFGAKLRMRGVKGGFVDAMRQLRAMPDKDRAEILKEDLEINEAYNLINANEELIRKRTAELDKAPGFSAQKKAQWAANPTTAAIQQRAEAEAARDVAKMTTLGVFGQQQAAGLAVAEQRQIAANPNNPLRRGLGGLAAKGAAGAGLPGEALPAVSAVGGWGGEKYLASLAAGPVSPFVMAAMLLKDAADKLNKAADKQVKGAKNRALNVEAAQQAN